MSVHQDVEERQGGSGSHQTCQGSGGREGHVLCKITHTQEVVSCDFIISIFLNAMYDHRRGGGLADKEESSERRG